MRIRNASSMTTGIWYASLVLIELALFYSGCTGLYPERGARSPYAMPALRFLLFTNNTKAVSPEMAREGSLRANSAPHGRCRISPSPFSQGGSAARSVACRLARWCTSEDSPAQVAREKATEQLACPHTHAIPVLPRDSKH